jgi:prepilin-type N-terminal cleavage/methylation domain-containing protein
MFKKNKGFTLVELLVVLAIIGILVGLAIGGIRIVQMVNRDTQRKAFVRDVQLLLEAHQERKNTYPGSITFGTAGTSNCGDNEVPITTEGGIEKGCSKVNFDIVDSDDCSALSADGYGNEEFSGNLTICYEGDTKGYSLYVALERSDPYNASNVEPE